MSEARESACLFEGIGHILSPAAFFLVTNVQLLRKCEWLCQVLPALRCLVAGNARVHISVILYHL